MPTYAELMEQKAALEALMKSQVADLAKAAEAARIAEHDAAVALVKEMMSNHGIKLSDLGTPRSKSARAARPAGASTRPNPLSGKKIPAKYRGVDEDGKPAAWSGRGLQPGWLKDGIAAGRKLEDFKVMA